MPRPRNPHRIRYDTEIREHSLSELDNNNPIFGKSISIVSYAHESCEALLKALDAVREKRHASRGALTDEEQDLLRAMLVMATSGLDSFLKQLINDGLSEFFKKDDLVKKSVRKFVERQLKLNQTSGNNVFSNVDFLSRLLISDSIQHELINSFVYDLTGNSLQSSEEVYKVLDSLGLDKHMIDSRRKILNEIFKIRNEIIHEMDIDFRALRRNRHSRSKGKMITYCNKTLLLCEDILKAACEKYIET